jgi:hypothetical protein
MWRTRPRHARLYPQKLSLFSSAPPLDDATFRHRPPAACKEMPRSPARLARGAGGTPSGGHPLRYGLGGHAETSQLRRRVHAGVALSFKHRDGGLHRGGSGKPIEARWVRPADSVTRLGRVLINAQTLEGPLWGKPDILCSFRAFPLLTQLGHRRHPKTPFGEWYDSALGPAAPPRCWMFIL